MGSADLLLELRKAIVGVCRKGSVHEFPELAPVVDTSDWQVRSIFRLKDSYSRYIAYSPQELEELGKNVASDYIEDFCRDLLSSNGENILVISLVFDGDRCPLKKVTTEGREERRRRHLEKARRFHRSGQYNEAWNSFVASIHMTATDLTYAVADEIAARFATEPRVQCIRSGGEADAQLVKLCAEGFANAIVTGDSDILLYLAARNISVPVLYNLKRSGACDIYSLDWLLRPTAVPDCLVAQPSGSFQCLLKACVEKELLQPGAGARLFVQVGVMAGCDYSKVDGIANATASMLLSKYADDAASDRFRNALIEWYRADGPYDERVQQSDERLSKAESVFYYHPVYETTSDSVVPLVEMPETNESSEVQGVSVYRPSLTRFDGNLSFLGEFDDSAIGTKIGVVSSPASSESTTQSSLRLAPKLRGIRSKPKADTDTPTISTARIEEGLTTQQIREMMCDLVQKVDPGYLVDEDAGDRCWELGEPDECVHNMCDKLDEWFKDGATRGVTHREILNMIAFCGNELKTRQCGCQGCGYTKYDKSLVGTISCFPELFGSARIEPSVDVDADATASTTTQADSDTCMGTSDETDATTCVGNGSGNAAAPAASTTEKTPGPEPTNAKVVDTLVLCMNAGRLWLCIKTADDHCKYLFPLEIEIGARFLYLLYEYVRSWNNSVSPESTFDLTYISTGGFQSNDLLDDFFKWYGKPYLQLTRYGDNGTEGTATDVFSSIIHFSQGVSYYRTYKSHEKQRFSVTGSSDMGFTALFIFLSLKAGVTPQEGLRRMDMCKDLLYCQQLPFSSAEEERAQELHVASLRENGLKQAREGTGLFDPNHPRLPEGATSWPQVGLLVADAARRVDPAIAECMAMGKDTEEQLLSRKSDLFVEIKADLVEYPYLVRKTNTKSGPRKRAATRRERLEKIGLGDWLEEELPKEVAQFKASGGKIGTRRTKRAPQPKHRRSPATTVPLPGPLLPGAASEVCIPPAKIADIPSAAYEVDFEVMDPPEEPAVLPSVHSDCTAADINDNDVVCGVGGGIQSLMGNRNFRKLVQDFEPVYRWASSEEKPLVARTVVLIIRKRGGRFLIEKDKNGRMFEVGDDEAARIISASAADSLYKGGEEMSGLVRPHSPEALQPRKRRRMRSGESIAAQDKFSRVDLCCTSSHQGAVTCDPQPALYSHQPDLYSQEYHSAVSRNHSSAGKCELNHEDVGMYESSPPPCSLSNDEAEWVLSALASLVEVGTLAQAQSVPEQVEHFSSWRGGGHFRSSPLVYESSPPPCSLSPAEAEWVLTALGKSALASPVEDGTWVPEEARESEQVDHPCSGRYGGHSQSLPAAYSQAHGYSQVLYPPLYNENPHGPQGWQDPYGFQHGSTSESSPAAFLPSHGEWREGPQYRREGYYGTLADVTSIKGSGRLAAGGTSKRVRRKRKCEARISEADTRLKKRLEDIFVKKGLITPTPRYRCVEVFQEANPHLKTISYHTLHDFMRLSEKGFHCGHHRELLKAFVEDQKS